MQREQLRLTIPESAGVCHRLDCSHLAPRDGRRLRSARSAFRPHRPPMAAALAGRRWRSAALCVAQPHCPNGSHRPRLAERDGYITRGILLQCRRESRRQGRHIGLPVTALHRTGHGMADVERTLALFIDFENLALGFQGARGRFDMGRVLKRMVEKGKIVAKKAYADWGRYSSYTEALHEAAIELIQIPRRAQTGKNSADIRLCVDAMDLAYSKEHIGTFVVVSGDSDFSPLVSKLKELGKHVIGLGMQPSTSDLLRDNCDEFIYYEDLETVPADVPNLDPQVPEVKRKAFTLLVEALTALRR